MYKYLYRLLSAPKDESYRIQMFDLTNVLQLSHGQLTSNLKIQDGQL